MSKWLKRLLGLAAVGSAIAGLIYYLKSLLKIHRKKILMTLKTMTLILIMI